MDIFDKYSDKLKKFYADVGEGDTLASQAAAAVNKLVYKWFNDGDTYDNTGVMKGWANDLSSYANWLASHIDGAEGILNMIWRVDGGLTANQQDEQYEKMVLEPLCELVCKEGFLEGLAQQPKDGSIYDCNGPYEFKDPITCNQCGCEIDEDEEYRYGGMCYDCYMDFNSEPEEEEEYEDDED